MTPPPLRPPPEPIRPLSAHSPLWAPLLVLLGAGAASLLARFWMQLQLPVPFCLLRKFTGVPCPGCGATRSLLAWAHFDPVDAFQFNPLLCCGVLAAGAWLLAAALDQFCGTRLLPRFLTRWQALPRLRIVVTLIALNWLYLCLVLPK